MQCRMPVQLPRRGVRHTSSTACTIIAMLLLASACQRSSIPSAQGPLPTVANPTPAASATPSLAATVSELRLIPSASSGTWRLVGMVRNDSAFAVQDVILEASLVDAIGRAQAQRDIRLPVRSLHAGESAPFEAFFADVLSATRVSVRVGGYQPGVKASLPIQVSRLEAVPTSNGGLAVLGRLHNASDEAALLQGLAITLRDPSSKELLGVAQRAAGLTRLEPGGTEPFLAVVQDYSGEAAFDAFVDSAPAPAPPSTVPNLSAAPVLSWTDQGKLFVVGQVKNPSPATMATALSMSLRADSEIMALADVTFNVPLGPGEIRPFCVEEFPGLEERMRRADVDVASLELEVRIDAGRTQRLARAAEPLRVQVTGYENVGSRLVLRGQVENAGDLAVRPTVLASALSTEGETLTAASLVLDDALQPGESASFLLTMPWPRGEESSMSEFDVRAFAVPP
jgi:hypothetical protein